MVERVFEDSIDSGFFDPFEAILESISFMPLIRGSQYSIEPDWNVRIISRSSNGGPRGKPDTMFNL